MFCPVYARNHTEIQVELSQGVWLSDTTTYPAEVAVWKLASSDRQKPNTILFQAVAYVLYFGPRECLSSYLNRTWQHFGQVVYIQGFNPAEVACILGVKVQM